VTYPAHPRLWKPQLNYLATVASNPSSPDYPAYQAFLAEANRYVNGGSQSGGVMSMTITAATHGNPTILTVTEPVTWTESNFAVGWIGTPGDCWNNINYQIGNPSTPTPWLTYNAMTLVDSHHLSVAFNSSACADWTGTAYGFSESAAVTGQIVYAYEGEGWIGPAIDLALAYRLTGNTVYAAKALQLLDFINNLVSVQNVAMIGADDGYPTRNVWYAVGLIYYFCYNQLTPTEKTATINSIKWYYNNMWSLTRQFSYGYSWALVWVTDCSYGNNHCPQDLFSWMNGNLSGYIAQNPNVPADSNYWGGNVTGLYYMGAAIAGDDAAGATIMADADAQFDNQMAVAFSTTPGYVGPMASGLSQEFYGYGNRNMGRFVEYMTARNYVEGINLFTSTNYAQLLAKAQIYGLRPDGWRGTPEWEATSDYSGVLDMGLPMTLSVALAGTTEGGWMQYLLTHASAVPGTSGLNQGLFISKGEALMWYSATNSSVDYTATQPTYLPAQPGDGHLYYRSVWGASGTWFWFRSSPIQWGPHNSVSAGNIEIQRGNDYILPSAGEWHGCNGYYSDGICPANDGASGAFNTFFFYDNGESASGGPCYAGAGYYGCQGSWAPYNNPTPITTANANYVYAEGQLSSAYHGKLSGLTPHPLPASVTLYYYIRGSIAVGDGTFVVRDLAQAKKIMNDGVNYIGNIRWHIQTTSPAISGNTVSYTLGASKLYIASFVGSGSTPAIRNCEVDSSDGSSPPAMHPYGSGGPWPCTGASGASPLGNISRIEVSDPSPSANLNVLTVLYATASSGSLPATSAITTDANHMGVLVADTTPKVVVFGKGVSATSSYPNYAATQYSSVTYTANYAGTAKHVVANMYPSTAWVATRNGVAAGSGTTDASGTVFFTDSVGGSFSISQAPAIPSGPGMSGRVSVSGAIAH